MVNNTNGELGIPPVNLNMYSDMKIAHDRYEVYVNADLVGDKTILTQNEDIFDIEHYLKAQGFEGFSTELDGDHFIIGTENPAEAAAMKKALEVYLNIR